MPDDIFISYAHIDDEPLGDTQGWVDTLFRRLRTRLSQLLGEEPVIWWDAREQSSQYLIGMIGSRVSGTRLLVSIVSPRYVNSVWCRAELQEFCRRADETGGIQINDQTRVFGVVKTPVRPDQFPPELGGLLRYEFYEIDANSRMREFRQEIGPGKDQRYWDKFEDLAQGIKGALEKLKSRPDAPPEPTVLPLEKKVYLAETTSDLSAERDRIKRELLERNYYVLPNRELPLSAHDFQSEVRAHLKRCALSIHLIGESYGIIPEGEEERSIVRLQEELAAERAAADPAYARLIWMPTGLKPSGNRQQKYVAELQAGLRAGSDFLQTTIEDLKTRILEKLNPETKTAKEANGDNGKSDGLTRVYLICDNRDANDVEPIGDYLWKQGYEVITSVDENENAQAAQYHRDNLVNCDATLIYYGSGNGFWLRSKLWDLQKVKGWGRVKPLSAAIYLSAPQTNEKRSFRTREVPLVMQNFGAFSPDALQPFLNAVRTRNGGQQ